MRSAINSSDRTHWISRLDPFESKPAYFSPTTLHHGTDVERGPAVRPAVCGRFLGHQVLQLRGVWWRKRQHKHVWSWPVHKDQGISGRWVVTFYSGTGSEISRRASRCRVCLAWVFFHSRFLPFAWRNSSRVQILWMHYLLLKCVQIHQWQSYSSGIEAHVNSRELRLGQFLKLVLNTNS